MIVFNHDSVVQSDPVILRTADRNGVFFQIAPAGRGLAGVENDAFSTRGLLVAARRGGGSAEALHEVQCGALPGQKRPRFTGYLRHDGSFFAEIALLHEILPDDGRIDRLHQAFGDIESAADAVLFGEEDGVHDEGVVDNRIGCGVSTVSEILVQRHLDKGVHSVPVDFRYPVHFTASPLYTLEIGRMETALPVASS